MPVAATTRIAVSYPHRVQARMLSLTNRFQRMFGSLQHRYLSDAAFVHINKTGGSSVEAALGLPFQHKTARELRDELGEKRWMRRFRFTVIRNPWDKVVSHYHYRVKTNQTGLGGTQRIPFGEWVERAYGDRDPRYYDQPKMFMPQCDWICDEHGQLMVEYVGRFETLADDFHHICAVLGRRATLPHLKPSGRGDHRAHYSDSAAAVVAKVFAADIDRFGYRFDPAE